MWAGLLGEITAYAPARARPAGAHTEQLLDDVAEVQALATGLQAHLGLGAAAAVKPDTVHELYVGPAQRGRTDDVMVARGSPRAGLGGTRAPRCRYGGAELHAVAALVGGIAAQEVIKLVTRQYVPFCHTFLLHTASGASVTLEL